MTGRGNGVPLVVDLAEFIPDGSPHFVPVQDHELSGLLMAMKQNSLRPVAVTSSRGMMENSIERIAGEMEKGVCSDEDGRRSERFVFFIPSKMM